MPATKTKQKSVYDFLTSGDIDGFKNYALSQIDWLQKGIDKAQKEQEILRNILPLLDACTGIAQESAAKAKKDELRLEWREYLENNWISEAGSINKKVWGKYEGWPNCLKHLAPYGDDDRSTGNMVHRPKRDVFDVRTIDFDTLIDCKLAEEEAHFKNLKKALYSK